MAVRSPYDLRTATGHGPERLGSRGPSAMLCAGAAERFVGGCTLGSAGETTTRTPPPSSDADEVIQ